MISLILFYFIYIFNVSFIIKGDAASINRPLSIDCGDQDIYNSIEYKCEPCSSKKKNHNNICYSNNPKSLYKNENLDCPDRNCDNCIGKLTELDNEGNWLGYLMCANTDVNINEIPSSVLNIDTKEFEIKIYLLSDPLAENPTMATSSITINNVISDSNDNYLISYYYYACRAGKYEKACNLIANFCVLSLYNPDNGFCKLINELSKDWEKQTQFSSDL